MDTEEPVRGDWPQLQYPDDRSDDLIRQLRHNLAWIEDLYRLSQQIAVDRQSGAVLEEILRHIVAGFSARSGSLSLLDRDGDQLTIVAGIDLPQGVVGSKIPMGRCVLGRVAAEQRAVLINGDLPDHLHDPKCPGRAAGAPASAMCWPLEADGQVVGVVSLNRGSEQAPFSDADLQHGQMLVNLVSLALENARLHQHQQQQIDALATMNGEMKRMNERLEQAHNQLLQQEKLASIGQLSAGVAHEINNPVGYVYSNLGTLRRYVDDIFEVLDAYADAEACWDERSPTVQRLRALKAEKDLDFLREDLASLVDESREGVTRVKQIVQDLKDFSHVGAADWETTDLHKGLDSTLNIVWNELKYKAEVVKEYGDLPPVECVPSQINQVFMNLLVNAAQAIDEFGTITVRTGVDGGDRAWVEISDTGKGIPAENLSRIFDPFFTTKPVGSGTGLGLSLSYGIVQQHNGTIDAQSEPGVGTTFRVLLPVQHDQAAATASAAAGG